MIASYAHLMHPELIAGSGLHGRAFGVTVIGELAATFAGGVYATVWWSRRRAGERRGLAYGSHLNRFSRRAILKRAKVILGVDDRDPRHSGLLLGVERYSKRQIWLSKEWTILVLAPPRSGKTSGTVAPAVVDHYGPVVATGVRNDIMNWTWPWRSLTGGPMWLCEPLRDDIDALPAGVRQVRWSPLQGCHDLATAKLRAEALFSALPKGGGNDEFWRTAGTALLAGYLMSAARHGGRISDVVEWIDRDTDESPVVALERVATELATVGQHTEAAELRGVARQLSAAIAQDPRYRAGVTGQAVQAIEPFRLPKVLQMCDVSIEESFDPETFLREAGTIWMLGSESHQRLAAGVLSAMTAAIVDAARSLARRCPHGRLELPLLLALDEAVNTAPIPHLDQLLSTGGGSGIQTIVVLQSLAAARNVWGKEMADALMDFNNVKVVLGGLSDAGDLQDLSTLLGQRDEVIVQASRSGATGVLGVGDHSWSWREVPVMRPSDIREIDSETHGEALVIARSTKGIIVRQDRIFNRPKPGAVARRQRAVSSGR